MTSPGERGKDEHLEPIACGTAEARRTAVTRRTEAPFVIVLLLPVVEDAWGEWLDSAGDLRRARRVRRQLSVAW